MDVAQRSSAQADRGGNVAQAAFHQHNVGRVYGHIGSRADGYPDVRARQRRGVVYPVADHCDLPLLHKTAYHTLLPVGKNTGYNMVNTGLRADGLRRALIVAGEHNDLDAHILKLTHSLRAVGLYDVRHGDYAE